ncbi:putative protein KIAA1671 [Dissostichus eleginoides]|nr:putative protein KIAA1671 [Dissostichus eleginoides]
MEYLGDKLSVAQTQMSGWAGNVRRSLHGALGFLSNPMERGGRAEDGTGDFKRTNSLRSLASRSRESIRRFSLRSQQRLSLRRRTAPNTPTSVQQKQSVSGEEEDSGTPVRDTDSQYGTWETGLRTDDSLSPATPSSESNLSPSPRKPTPPHMLADPGSQFDSDAPDGVPQSTSESQPLPFPDVPTALLDTSALRSRAHLVKKRAPRARPSRAARQTVALSPAEGGATDDWLYRDSTEAKPQRIPLFTGMDPSALKANLRRRGDSDSQMDGSTPSPSQLSRSPKSPFLPRATRVLPPAGGKENGEEDSPQWLKELKSKKRLSQYENES